MYPVTVMYDHKGKGVTLLECYLPGKEAGQSIRVMRDIGISLIIPVSSEVDGWCSFSIPL